MNYSTAIFLTNDDVAAVKVSYEVAPDGTARGELYSFKTFDKSLAVGDYVVVPTNTRHKMTVCRVEEINVEVPLEPEFEMRWIIGRVDRESYEAILKLEEQMIVQIKSAKKRRERAKLAEELLADNPELRNFAQFSAEGLALSPPPPVAEEDCDVQPPAPEE